ncbi:MAG TPA: hypothetical protein VF624_06965, partial [Tepidisphaeraceae bacterium]|jgi:hypothetical protein
LAAIFNERWSASPFEQLTIDAVTRYEVGWWDSIHYLFVVDVAGSDSDRVRSAILGASEAAVGRQELERVVRKDAIIPEDFLKNFEIEAVAVDKIQADRYTVFEYSSKRLGDSSLHRLLEIWVNTRGERVLIRHGFY